MYDEIVAVLAAHQLGVFARFQLLEQGIASSLIDRRLASGQWLRVAPGVYALPGHADSWARRLWIVYLAAGPRATVSHESAAASHHLRQFPPDGLALTMPHPHHARVAGATVHQTRFLPSHHVELLYGRRTTTVARTLVDLATFARRRDLELAYEDAILTDRLSHARMSRCFTEVLHPARRGLRMLGEILDERGPGFVVPASDLERMLFGVCARVGLSPVRQHPHPGREIVDGCVDGALPEAKLILEADGRRWHARVDALRHDRRRDKAAGRAGWQTLRVGHEELSEDPRREAETIREIYDERCRLLSSST